MRSKLATLFMAFFLFSPALVFASASRGANPVMATTSSKSHTKRSHHRSKKNRNTKKTKKSKKG